MKKGAFSLFSLLLVLVFSLSPLMADDVTTYLEAKIIESFDDEAANGWTVKGSKFTTQGYPKMTFVKTWPEALFGKNIENVDRKVLGIHGKFDRKEFNAIDIIPTRPITIPGRVRALDLWVWGSNFDYTLEVHIMDYKGLIHVIQMGGLLYEGWKDLVASIPDSIPQSKQYLPKKEELKIVKLVLWTKPSENVSDFYVYFDQIKVLTDTFESPYDGYDLSSPAKVNEIWSSVEGKP